jgi:RNase P subunit RPR2
VSAADFDHINRRITTLTHAALMRRTIRLTCRRCPHARRFDPIPIWWLFQRKRWRDTFDDVPKRFYCSRCLAELWKRVRDPAVAITNEEPEPSKLPYPDEREWKRFVRRYRS